MGQRTDYVSVIVEEEKELRFLLRKAKQTLLKRRLQFLLLLKTRLACSLREAGPMVGVGRRGAEEMWALYRRGGLQGYLVYPFKGRKPTLGEGDRSWLVEELSTAPTRTLKQTAVKIKEHTGSKKPLSPQAVHYIFKALKIKKKLGRPSHILKDEDRVEAFKKKTSRS